MLRIVLIHISVLLLSPLNAGAQLILFTTIANSSTPAPGGAGTFGDFLNPSIDNGHVAFFSQTSTGQIGIYSDAGGSLAAVATDSTHIPNGTGNFTGFQYPAISNGHVLFSGTGSSNQHGLYTNQNGPLTMLVDSSTPIPGGGGNFLSFGNFPSYSNGQYAFVGSNGGGQQGVFSNIGGTLAAIARIGQPIPSGSGGFTSFNTVSVSNGRVAFDGGAPNQAGIYTSTGGALQVLANQSTPVPGGIGNFNVSLGSPVQSNGHTAFTGGQGIFSDLTGSLAPVVLGSNFSRTSLSNDRVFFAADIGGHQGMYSTLFGALQPAILLGDALDGSTVVGINFTQTSLSGNQFVFAADLANGTHGVYVGTAVPEPTSLALCAAAVVGFATSKRRRVPKQAQIP